MPVYDPSWESASVILRCGYKHDFGCECWRRAPEVTEARKARIRSRLGRSVRRPLP